MMNHRRRVFALIAGMAVLAIALGVLGSLAAVRAVDTFTSTKQSLNCSTRTATTDDPALLAVTQGLLEAQRTFALYRFNGVSDEPRIVGYLDPGDQFCLSEADLDWGVTITEGSAEAPIGIIRTPNYPDGVYSGVVGSLPVLHQDDDEDGSGHRVIPLHGGQEINLPSDSPVLPPPVRYAAMSGLAGQSQQVTGLRAGEVHALH